MPERDLIGIQILRKRLDDERRQPEFATDLLLCEKTVRNLEKSKANREHPKVCVNLLCGVE